MHSIIQQYGLDGEFRWLVAQKDPVRNGEIYRFVAGGCTGGGSPPSAPRQLFLSFLHAGRRPCRAQCLPAHGFSGLPGNTVLGGAFRWDAEKGYPQ